MDWENHFIQGKVIWQYQAKGAHAIYTLSDKHSDYYFNSSAIEPSLLEEIGIALYKKI